MIIGKRLKEARLKKGMSQEELGNLLGVSKVSICGYEKGTRTPTMENFLDLIEILDLEPDYVLGRDKNVVSEKDKTYNVVMADEDIQIINELKGLSEGFISEVEVRKCTLKDLLKSAVRSWIGNGIQISTQRRFFCTVCWKQISEQKNIRAIQ